MSTANFAYERDEDEYISEIRDKKHDAKSDNVRSNTLTYGLEDVPKWYNCIAFGFQHFLIAFGGIISIPILLADGLCMTGTDEGNLGTALLIATVFFTSGICTLIQTTLGTRLPIVQGSTFSIVTPTLAILNLPHNQCPEPITSNHTNGTLLYNDTDGEIVDGDELWHRRMREVQGAIMIASILEFVLGLTGAVGFILRYVGPLTITPAIALIGLDLFTVGSDYADGQWGISFFTTFLLILCSQYIKNVPIPFPWFSLKKKCHVVWAHAFKMYPVLFALVTSWLLCFILTETNVFPNDPLQKGYRARTDLKSEVLKNSPWFRFPYPGQWGTPVVTSSGVIGMLAGTLAGMIESVGDYYACARMTDAPPPPPHAVNRGILVEGFGCVFSGWMGSGSATTSYSENIGAIGITRVGSRRVIQTASLVLIILGLFPKFSAIFVTIPDPVIGGIFCSMFGVIAAVGLSNLQYVDLNSPRNLFILGFSLFIGLMVAEWIKANPDAIQTGVPDLDQIIVVLLSTSMFIGGILGMFLDNTIPGTPEERGILYWREVKNVDAANDVSEACYNLPFSSKFKYAKYIPFLPEFSINQQNTKDFENDDFQMTQL